MKLNSKKIAALLVLAGALVVALPGVALAGPPWSDAPNSWWVSSYDVTESQVATLADGFPDGTFRPGLAVTRGQFAKMTSNGLDVPIADPPTATFQDVIPSHRFYVYIEGLYAKQIIGGYPTSTGLYYKPDNNISRQQANSILGRYLSQLEIDITGSIHGDVSTYGSLDLWYSAEGEFYLKGYDDWSKVATSHKPATAYLIYRDIVQGSNHKLNALSTLLRSQAAALILRVKAEAQAIMTPPEPPTNLGVTATGIGMVVVYDSAEEMYLGNDSTPQVTGDTLPSRPIAVYDTIGSSTTKLIEDASNAAGKFYTDLPPALSDGVHSFTAKVKNDNGLVSPASESVEYLLDTEQPSGSITQPVVPSGSTSAVLTSNKPLITATATDTGSGVKQVVFQCAVKSGAPAWQTISTDTVPETGTTTYAAVWPTTGTLSGGLSEGTYLLRVVVTDVVGNESTSDTIEVTLDTTEPTVEITAPVALGVFYTDSTMPTFTAAAVDPSGTGLPASGIASVHFYYAPKSSSPTTWGGFTLISMDTTPDYAAAYVLGGLPEGHFIFAVKAVDSVGGESALMNATGSAYVTGVTQEVIIDASPPSISITSPYAGQNVEEGQTVAINWMLADITPPDTVKIEYTLDASVAAPIWQQIPDAVATPNDGSHHWVTPEIPGDRQHVRVRITAVDKAGEKVGDIPGHTAMVRSQEFTLYDNPLAVEDVAGTDDDSTGTGVDGRDFHVTWTASLSDDITLHQIYILPADQDVAYGSDVPVGSADGAAVSWTGDASLTKDSRGADLAAGEYKIWILVTDPGGRTRMSTASAAFTVTSD